LHRNEAVQRRWAAEYLDRAEDDDVARVVSGLAGAVGDPDWQVRRAAARSLANVIQRCAANPKRDPGAIKEAVENDPATEVRTAAMGALFTGWPEHSRNKDVLGR
jgi:HEAT repeat protein